MGTRFYFPPGATVEVNFTESAQSAMATATGMSLSFWLRPLVSLDQELLEFGRLTIKAKRGRIRAESNAFGRLVSDNVLRRMRGPMSHYV